MKYELLLGNFADIQGQDLGNIAFRYSLKLSDLPRYRFNLLQDLILDRCFVGQLHSESHLSPSYAVLILLHLQFSIEQIAQLINNVIRIGVNTGSLIDSRYLL